MPHTSPLGATVPSHTCRTRPAVTALRTVLGTALALSLLLSLTACGSKVHYLDHTAVEISDVKERKEDGVITLNIAFKNEDNDDVNHSVYKVEWYDSDGHYIEGTSWRPLTMRGGVTVQVIERSTAAGADDYKILISNDAR